MSNLQQKIQAAVSSKIDALISQAIDNALGGGTQTAMPKVQPSMGNGSSNSAVVQDLADSVRRALRYSRNGHSLSKAERKVMADAVKAAKANYNITSGANDLFSRAGC